MNETVEPFPGVELPAAWALPADAYYDADAADRAVRFFPRYCRHTKGALAGKPFELAPWQEKRIVRPLYGLRRADGSRLIRTAFVFVPRKNGKSQLASGIAMRSLYADGEQGAEVYSAAVDREQASIVFNAALAQVEMCPELRERSRIFRGNYRRIVNERTRGVYRAIPSDARAAHGFNAHAVLCDELHVWPGAFVGSLLEALITSVGARRQPLVFMITTAGFDRTSICAREYARACQIRDGLPVPSYLPVIYEAPPESDWKDPDVWAIANPNLGISVSHEYMQEACERARETPADENSFRRLHLDTWTEQRTRWIPLETWDACAEPGLDMESLRGCRVAAALDLSTREDTTALALAFLRPDQTVALFVRFWIPEDNALRREALEHVPYGHFRSLGLITFTPGVAIDYLAVLTEAVELARRFHVPEIGYDPWNAEFFRQELERSGFATTEFRQGWRSMGEPTASFGRLWRSKRLRHDGNQLLRFQAANTAVLEDPAGNLKPAKDRSGDRIDGIVAAIMACWLLISGDGALDADAVVNL